MKRQHAEITLINVFNNKSLYKGWSSIFRWNPFFFHYNFKVFMRLEGIKSAEFRERLNLVKIVEFD